MPRGYPYLKLKDLAYLQQEFWYTTYKDKEVVLDDEGYETGEYRITYNNPVKAKARVGYLNWYNSASPFGKDVVYDKGLSTVQDLPIDEYTLLYIDVTPDIKADGSTDTPPDYTCVAVRKDLNRNVWAIKKIKGYEENND